MPTSTFFHRWTTPTVLLLCLGTASGGFLLGRWRTPPAPAILVATPGTRRPSASRTLPARIAAADAPAVAPRGTATLRGRANELESLARRDGAKAVALALREPNLVIRGVLRDAALRGWAAISPNDAADWALQLPEADRANALAAVFAGAVENPAAAIAAGKRVCAQFPEAAAAYGDLLVRALADQGDYTAAVEFAAGGLAPNRPGWVNTAFATWSAYEPEAAAAALEKLGDAEMRHAALAGLGAGWASADPARLADYAVKLDPGETRDDLLAQALSRWALANPADALRWMTTQPANVSVDAGLSTIATRADVVATRPDIGIECASAITQADLRVGLLRMLAQSWAAHDRGSAVRFVAGLRTLDPTDRAALDEGMAAP